MNRHPSRSELSRTTSQGIVIYGPAGCGKSTHAQALARHYGKDRIVDDWQPGGKVSSNTLALTNIPRPGAIHFLDAARAAGIRLKSAVVQSLMLDRRAA